ncbi:MAG: DinB family protein [Candidatus Bathyarchaeia archaeon]
MFAISELYDYASCVRRRFADRLAELPWETLERNREASFYSMKNILLHMVDNEDWIVNWVIPGRSGDYVRRKWVEYTSIGMVLAHLEEVEKKTRAWLAGIDEDGLRRKVRFTLSSGNEFELVIEECLLQSFTEQLYHMGELIALMWQENIEPPKMQWFWNNPRSS